MAFLGRTDIEGTHAGGDTAAETGGGCLFLKLLVGFLLIINFI
jgi:hypothetical protein